MKTPIIEVTTEYSQFRVDPSNRPINPHLLARLIDSIKAKNMLADKPINVSADGVVLDGQHRLLAARELGVPIYYIVSDTMTIQDVPGMPAQKWTTRDYLNMWVAHHNEEYEFVAELEKHYPGHPLSTFQHLLFYGDNIRVRADWERGTFKAIRRHFAVVVLNGARDFAPYISWWKKPKFILALASVFDTPDYSHERMMRKIKRQSARLTEQVDVDGYLIILGSIYNFGEPTDKHIIFKNRKRTQYRSDHGDDLQNEGGATPESTVFRPPDSVIALAESQIQ